ncbi:outer membrane protein assembly factor BamB family protein [Streptomyces sp. NPDC002073]
MAVTGAAALALLLVAAGGYAVWDAGYSGKPAKPVAQRPSRTPGPAQSGPSPQGSPDGKGGSGAGRGSGEPVDLGAGRKPGEAAGWMFVNDMDLPAKPTLLNDLWIVGDTVVQAGYKEVTAYRLAGGTKAWTLPLPHPVCDTPVNPTPDGKVVIAYQSGEGESYGSKCNNLLMVDLRTGAKGWHRQLVRKGSMDDTTIVHLAITGDTVAVARNLSAVAYRVGDGKELFTIPAERMGGCYPTDVAGGSRLLVVDTCALGGSHPYNQVRELDPESGRMKWRYAHRKQDWAIYKVLSADPVVLLVQNRSEHDDWTYVALRNDGKPRPSPDIRTYKLQPCNDRGDAGEGVQNCQGSVTDGRFLYIGSENKLAAFNLATGKFAWGAKGGPRRNLVPLRTDGAAVIAYTPPSGGEPGATVRIKPGGSAAERLLVHASAGRAAELSMFAGRVVYHDGRIVVTPSMLSGSDKKEEARMVSYGR